MVKFNEISLNELSNENSLRFDFNYLSYTKSKPRNYYKFNELFEEVSNEKLSINEKINYCEIGNVNQNGLCNPVGVDLDNETYETQDLIKKIRKNDIQKAFVNDILISKIRPNLKKIVFVDESLSKVFFTKAFIQLKPKKNPVILYFLLRTRFLKSIISVSRIGKGYPTLHIDDLNKMYFDKKIVDNFLNDSSLINKLKSTLLNIKDSGKEIKKEINIIDDKINKYLDIPVSIIHKENKIINQTITLSEISRSNDLRLGYNYNRKSHKSAVNYLLSKNKYHYIADIIDPDCKIRLGQTIVSQELKEEPTGYYYVTPKSISTSKIIREDCAHISKEFYEKNKENYQCNKGDIILRRSGESIGKVAICEIEDHLIVSDFSMRLRIKDYNKKFVYYYLRSSFFQFLIKSNCKTLDLHNIYPSIVEKLLIPKISNHEQEKICLSIDKEINFNDEIHKKIDGLIKNVEEILNKKF